jgi:uncharacterized protein (TIGR02001 family)
MQIRKLGKFALAASLAAPAMALSMNAQAELSANIGVVSKYMFRGVEESGGPAVQGGIDYAHESGFYAGWWASSLGYTDTSDSISNSTGVENDFYVGYETEVGDFTIGGAVYQYYYIDVDDADATEIEVYGGWGPLSLSVTYNATDVVWSNSGDIYVALGYEAALPYGFDFGATLGYYNYDDDDAGNSKADLGTTESGNMQHLDLTLSRAIADTPATMSVTYMIGGKDRSGEDIDDTLILGLTYEFDL